MSETHILVFADEYFNQQVQISIIVCDSLSDINNGAGSLDFTYVQEAGVTSLDLTYTDLIEEIGISNGACPMIAPYVNVES